MLVLVLVLAACSKREPFHPPPFQLPWTCAGATCTQRYPELPDDGEWECADVEGVVLCRGAAGASAAGWACGARRGAAGERICVDDTPDVPVDGAWDCHYDHSPERRVCVRAGERRNRQVRQARRQLGAPDCWLDTDCEGGSCVEGRCG